MKIDANVVPATYTYTDMVVNGIGNGNRSSKEFFLLINTRCCERPKDISREVSRWTCLKRRIPRQALNLLFYVL